MFTDAAIKEIARIALERGTGARGLRAVVEEVLEGVLFEVEAGIRYVITREDGQGWGGGEAEHGADEGTAELACAAKNCEPQECTIAWAKSTMRSESRSR